MSDRPHRIAVVGAGPAGFYATGHLLDADAAIEVDLYDRLPTPWGLVRGGVAPDHPKIKAVSKVFEKIGARLEDVPEYARIPTELAEAAKRREAEQKDKKG